MNQKFEEINIRQFDLMKHAVGLDQIGAKPKRGKYIAYRNYFCTRGIDSDWEILVECGLATSRKGDSDIYPSSVFYHVSDDGIKFMERIIGFKIIVE